LVRRATILTPSWSAGHWRNSRVRHTNLGHCAYQRNPPARGLRVCDRPPHLYKRL